MRLAFGRFILVVCHLLFISSIFAHPNHRGSGISMSVDDSDRVTDCSDLRVQFDGDRVPVVEDRMTIPRAAGSTLRVSAHRNGGVQVRGGVGSDYQVRLCKAVSPFGQINASQIRLTNEAGVLTVTGPRQGDDDDRNRWVGYILIDAPANAAMDIEAHNGPITLNDVDGRIKARATNGPISLVNPKGVVDAKTQNGPISFRGSEGDLVLRAENGPLAIKLDGDVWKGKGLDAQTMNGPLSLSIGRGYRSGVALESRGHSPWSCKDEACRDGRKDWDDDTRRIEFGSPNPVIRISTTNGPVSIKERD